MEANGTDPEQLHDGMPPLASDASGTGSFVDSLLGWVLSHRMILSFHVRGFWFVSSWVLWDCGRISAPEVLAQISLRDL